MKLAVIGGKGMLGTDLCDACARHGIEALPLDLPEIDITRRDGLGDAIPACDGVVNCAAFTRVDDAEKEREPCWRINAEGAGNVAQACAARGLPLIHLSTDYVFNGTKGSPYVESDAVDALNFYGESKLAGERAVLAAGGHALIVRTQSLYGLRGRSFVRAILNQIRAGKTTLRVVADQVSSPTYTPHLAEGLLACVRARVPAGIVHIAATGRCSWWEFAREIVERVKPGIEVQKLVTAELNVPALRPAFSVLDCSKFAALTGHALPHWRDGLAAFLAAEST